MKSAVIQKPHALKNSYFEIHNFLQTGYRDAFIKDIKEGFSRYQKMVPSKYFYDVYGCRLFDQICCTPEYYLTRTEFSILNRFASEIMSFFRDNGGDLVELGSGSNKKIRLLMDSIDSETFSKIRYVPVDISAYSIGDSSRELIDLYNDIRILGIVADFTRHLENLPTGRKMFLFLGSTIGNFSDDDALVFLKKIRRVMTREDRFLLGLDMVKPPEIIEAAYNDETGLTEKFNRNILEHINRELNAEFNVADFSHLAFFDKEKERVEMHLEAKRSVQVRIWDLSLTVGFKKGETVHTEISNKFTRERAATFFRKAGLRETSWFTDPEEWFSLVMLRSDR